MNNLIRQLYALESVFLTIRLGSIGVARALFLKGCILLAALDAPATRLAILILAAQRV